MEIQQTATLRKLREEEAACREEGALSDDYYRLAQKHAGLRASQLEERRLSAIEQGDEFDAEEAATALAVAREDLRALETETEIRARRKASVPTGGVATQKVAQVMPTVVAGGERVAHSNEQRLAAAKRMVAEFRDYFDTHPAPYHRIHMELAMELKAAWDDYAVAARQLVAAPVTVAGRSERRARVQWVKYTGQMLSVGTKRVTVVTLELQAAEVSGDAERTEFLKVLFDVVSNGVKLVAEVVNAAVALEGE
jgi:hypothetical protein